MSFEAALAELERIVNALEQGRLDLSESLGQYEQGVQHLKRCYDLLARAERRIEMLAGFDADGNPVTTPFDESEQTLEEKARSRSRRRSSRDVQPAAGGSAPHSDEDTLDDSSRGLF